MSKDDIFTGTVQLRKKIWFYLTCLRPVTKYEFANLQAQLIVILEGMRSGDLHHYQIEKMLEQEVLKLKQGGTNDSKKQTTSNDNMFN